MKFNCHLVPEGLEGVEEESDSVEVVERKALVFEVERLLVVKVECIEALWGPVCKLVLLSLPAYTFLKYSSSYVLLIVLVLPRNFVKVAELLHIVVLLGVADSAKDGGGGDQFEHKLILCLCHIHFLQGLFLPEVSLNEPSEVQSRALYLCP